MKDINEIDEENSFLDTIVNYAIVIRAALRAVRKLREEGLVITYMAQSMNVYW